jgi:hypothetical protein
MRITYDSNTLDKVARPERFPKDPRQTEYCRIHSLLKEGAIKGFFCETIVTCEGIQRIDRAEVLSKTTLNREINHSQNENGELVIELKLKTVMPTRKPLHPEVIKRMQAALKIGMKTLGAPRIGWPRIEDPENVIYFQDGQNSITLSDRIDRYLVAGEAIQARGVGFSQIENLARKFALRAVISEPEPWYTSLNRAKDIHEENEIKRAVAEWADGDSVAAHIGYGIDFFCTEDKGNSAGASSIFDAKNRNWLTDNFGLKFVSLSDVAKMISS